MTDFSQDNQQQQQFSSRRGFFKWTRQVMVGAACVGIGLGIADSHKALAAEIPDCIPCPPPHEDTVCRGTNDGYCGPSLYYHEVWDYTGGCLYNTKYCCPHTVSAQFCSTSCYNHQTCL